jgi:hypothetical protein
MGTFGYSAAGASLHNQWESKVAYGSKFVLSEAAALIDMWACVGFTEISQWELKIYADNAGSIGDLLFTSELIQTSGYLNDYVWIHGGISGQLQPGVYWLMCDPVDTQGWQNWNMYYDSGESNQGLCSSTYNDKKFSIYATYTAGSVLKSVFDSMAAADNVLRNKALIVIDDVDVADAMKGNKNTLIAADTFTFDDAVSTPSRVLSVSDSISNS